MNDSQKIIGLDDAKRCPACHQAPEPTTENGYDWTLQCERHGHMAMGASLEKAVQNWNKYVTFIESDGMTHGG